MEQPLPYRLDDEPINGPNLIRYAVDNYGYAGTDGMFFTSEAAALLRKHGHTVTTNQQKG